MGFFRSERRDSIIGIQYVGVCVSTVTSEGHTCRDVQNKSMTTNFRTVSTTLRDCSLRVGSPAFTTVEKCDS